MSALNKRQQMFVAEYLVDQNATRSAIAAGYSKKTAKSAGQRLLTHVDIAPLLQQKHNKRLQNLEITADKTLQEIAKLAFYDPRRFFEADGSMKRIHEIDDDSAMAIAGFEVIELFGGSGDQKHAYGLLKKVKLVSKLGSLELLGKHLKLFNESLDIHLRVSIADRILNARNRLTG